MVDKYFPCLFYNFLNKLSAVKYKTRRPKSSSRTSAICFPSQLLYCQSPTDVTVTSTGTIKFLCTGCMWLRGRVCVLRLCLCMFSPSRPYLFCVSLLVPLLCFLGFECALSASFCASTIEDNGPGHRTWQRGCRPLWSHDGGWRPRLCYQAYCYRQGDSCTLDSLTLTAHIHTAATSWLQSGSVTKMMPSSSLLQHTRTHTRTASRKL